MSTLVNEPLAEALTETLEPETTEIDLVDESVITDLSLEEDVGKTDSLAATEEASEGEEVTTEASADVIALKPEDLADIKNKVESGSDETIETTATQLSEDEDIESEESIDATAELDTNIAQAEENSEIEEVIELEANAENTIEDTEEITEEISDEDVSEEGKPSRSRALLLTSLLSTTKPISQKELKKVLKLSPKAVLAAIEDLKTTLYEQDLGLMMEEVAGGYRVIIQPNLYTDLAALISPPPLPQLSSAALETLAIISYKQPITRGELEAARGTGCSSTLDTLQERDLIKILGQKDVVGKPLLYGTTERFLLEFGLKSLEDLPPLDEKPTEFLRS